MWTNSTYLAVFMNWFKRKDESLSKLGGQQVAKWPRCVVSQPVEKVPLGRTRKPIRRLLHPEEKKPYLFVLHLISLQITSPWGICIHLKEQPAYHTAKNVILGFLRVENIWGRDVWESFISSSVSYFDLLAAIISHFNPMSLFNYTFIALKL